MIRSFADRDTERVWRREPAKRFDPRIHKTANRKLHLLDAATSLDTLRVPPGNRLETLKGDRVGQHSIRINGQWRICFRWTEAGPEDIEIVDYQVDSIGCRNTLIMEVLVNGDKGLVRENK